jgi:hypothetical protein
MLVCSGDEKNESKREEQAEQGRTTTELTEYVSPLSVVTPAFRIVRLIVITEGHKEVNNDEG